MRIKDFRPGLKVYNQQPAKYLHDEKSPPILEVIYIMDVDRKKSMVCASINKNPARWFEYGQYSKWTTEQPQ